MADKMAHTDDSWPYTEYITLSPLFSETLGTVKF